MIRISLLALLVATPLSFAQTPPGKTVVKLNGHTFTLPDGFTIELVAKAPLVDRPVSASFDDAGRLYVTISSGSNARGPQQAEEKSHRIVRLEDTDGDGVFDKSIVFADKLAMPQGILWHQGAIYTATPPQILKLTDTDGDGKADKREVWHQGTVTGCMNDLHGPWLGPDGWIYWTKGAWQEQTYKVRGKDFTTRACHIFRARPDGSGLEPVMTGGMDNPVGLAFTPTGERIVSGTFFQFPADGKRDGLIHAVYGGIYGKDHDPIHDPVHKWTSPHVLPIMTHLGAAAPCGMTRFESHLFGKEYQDNLFCCLFNMQKVTRHILLPDGATYKTQDSDFVVSDQKDFHPTDVIEDADGSLLVIDTGGWYKICCPTSQLVKPDVFGAIYRVRKVGAEKLADPYGRKVNWKEPPEKLIRLLDDPRVPVRRKAIHALSQGGLAALAFMESVVRRHRTGVEKSSLRAINALTATSQMEEFDLLVISELSAALGDPDLTPMSLLGLAVQEQSLALQSFDRYLAAHESLDSQAIRLAAEAIARVASQTPNPVVSKLFGPAKSDGLASNLMSRLKNSSDAFLNHAVIHALIHIQDKSSVASALKSADTSIRRAGLIVADQLNWTEQDFATQVLRELNSDNARLRETAWWIVSRHPEWSGEVAKHLESQLASKTLAAKDRAALIAQLAPQAKSPVIQAMIANCALSKTMPVEARSASFKAMVDAKLRDTPEVWLNAVTAVLEQGDAKLQQEAVAAAYALRLPKNVPSSYSTTLFNVGMNPKTAPLTRVQALAAIITPPLVKEPVPELFQYLASQVTIDKPAAQRGFAATALSRQRPSSQELLALAGLLSDVGPLELDRVLDAFAHTKDDAVGAALLTALESPKLRPSLRADMVKTRLAKFSPELQKRSVGLMRALNGDIEKQQARLEALLGNLKNGDIARGQAIFNSQKTACVVCHSIGYLGGKVGPDLTRIGGIRTERDLLEAIVFPSASFVRSYEPVLVIMNDGKTHNGVVKRDSADELVLVTGVNQEVRVARADIEEIQPSKVSVMPAGLDQQLSPQDLADLVAFLKANK